MTSDKEKYICHNCLTIAALNSEGRCSSCNSDSVTSVEAIQQMTPKAESRLNNQLPRPTASRHHDSRQWFLLVNGSFETVVSYLKASSLEEAIRYSQSTICEWYFVNDRIAEYKAGVLNHGEYLQWCQKMWPSVTSLNTEESTA